MSNASNKSSAISHIVNKAFRYIEHKILRDFKELGFLQNSRKGTSNFAQNSFDYIAKSLYQDLKNARPAFGFVINGQEICPPKDKSTSKYIIQPIDGFDNFMHAIPYFAVNIIVENNNVIEQFFAFNPILKIEFEINETAALLNQQKVKVSKRDNISDGLLASNYFMAGVNLFNSGCITVDLAYFSSARFDGCVYKNFNINDLPILAMLCKATGGKAEQIGDIMLLSNGAIHNQIKKIL